MNHDSLSTIQGVITKFAGNGRKLGYPTANLTTGTDLADGVYFGTASLGKYSDRPAIMFIGTPTTMGDSDRRVEAHILDFPDKDYYGQSLKLEVQHFHRPNQTFDSINELTIAMKQDEAAARKWFAII